MWQVLWSEAVAVDPILQPEFCTSRHFYNISGTDIARILTKKSKDQGILFLIPSSLVQMGDKN